MKTFIQNRAGQKICVVVEGPEVPGKLAFVMHGLGGDKDRPLIRTIAEALLESGYTVVTFDTTDSFGESEGNYENATATNSYTDLEAVIDWARLQSWYKAPFVLAGHSLGGICAALFAEKHPEKVRALAPIATVVSGELSFETHRMFPERLEKLETWKRNGVHVTVNQADNRKERLKWSHMEDRLRYDLLPKAGKLTMPVLLIAGENDKHTPPVHQKILFDELPDPKEIHTITGAGHIFKEPGKLAELKQIFKNWLELLG